MEWKIRPDLEQFRIEALGQRTSVDGEKEAIVGSPAAAQKQNAARSQDPPHFLGILTPLFPANVMAAPAIGDQVKKAVVKRRVERAAFVPVHADALFASALLGEAESLRRKVNPKDLIVHGRETDGVRSRSAAEIEHASSRRKPRP